VRERTFGAYAHQDLPFEKIVEELAPDRDLSRSPVFQVMFALQNAPTADVEETALRLSFLDGKRQAAKYDLTLTLAEVGDELHGGVAYAEDLFEESTARRITEHMVTLLESVAADPDLPVSALAIFGDDERRRVLEEWNATEAEYPAGLCVHELFEAQARRTPAAAAVVAPGERLTYAELDERADRLAHALRGLGVGPDARVGLFLERGAEVVVAVLGILKAGAAYVALDPGYPDERLLFMLEDAGAAVLVTHAPLEGRLGAFGGARVDVDTPHPRPLPHKGGGEHDYDTTEGEDRSVEMPLPRNGGGWRARGEPGGGLSPDNLCYVIYTSGSTGTPKGVLGTHRGVVNYLTWFDREVLGEEGFDLPLVSRLSFDAHVRQLFPPLLRGGAVWVLPEETVTDPAALLAELAGRERVSFGGVPSLWSAMLERVRSGETPKPGGLRAVLLGGEALSPELVERTLATFPGVAVWNHYGPTEATVNTTVARLGAGEAVHVGRPVANVRVYLLDAHGGPVPVGVPGELYVGGAGVSRGYLGRPELTAERFVPDPFSAEAGARMYRSGDRVRWREEGTLEYLGRTDQQVKVRGFRIEPGEIEGALRAHPGVRDAVVVAREDEPGERRLVAYVTGREGAEAPTSEELRAHLRERLPDYMVPAAFVALERIPLTPNGKTDRRGLPAPEAGSEEAGEEEPRTPAEEILAGIFAEVLKLDRVGARQGFFELGGHSLLATRVVSRVRAAFGIELPLRAVFEAPTVAGLAERVEALLRASLGVQAPPLVPVPRDRPLPASFAQQ
ncbi:MAG TPA: amino acid adenylation domain-containing protein, partial [Longimicrobiaceae bacterium]